MFLDMYEDIILSSKRNLNQQNLVPHHVWIHWSLPVQELRIESDNDNEYQILLSSNGFIYTESRVNSWPDLTVIVFKSHFIGVSPGFPMSRCPTLTGDNSNNHLYLYSLLLDNKLWHWVLAAWNNHRGSQERGSQLTSEDRYLHLKWCIP